MLVNVSVRLLREAHTGYQLVSLLSFVARLGQNEIGSPPSLGSQKLNVRFFFSCPLANLTFGRPMLFPLGFFLSCRLIHLYFLQNPLHPLRNPIQFHNYAISLRNGDPQS